MQGYYTPVADVAALRALGAASPLVGRAIIAGTLLAYSWSPASTIADNGLTVIKATAVTTGRWIGGATAIGSNTNFSSLRAQSLTSLASGLLTNTAAFAPYVPSEAVLWLGDSLVEGFYATSSAVNMVGIFASNTGYTCTNDGHASSYAADMSTYAFTTSPIAGSATHIYCNTNDCSNYQGDPDKQYLTLNAYLATCIQRGTIAGANKVRGQDGGMTKTGAWSNYSPSLDIGAIYSNDNGATASATVTGRFISLLGYWSDGYTGEFDVTIGDDASGPIFVGHYTTQPPATIATSLGQDFQPFPLIWEFPDSKARKVTVTITSPDGGNNYVLLSSIIGTDGIPPVSGPYVIVNNLHHHTQTSYAAGTGSDELLEQYGNIGMQCGFLSWKIGILTNIAELGSVIIAALSPTGDLWNGPSPPSDGLHWVNSGHLKGGNEYTKAYTNLGIPLPLIYPQEYARATGYMLNGSLPRQGAMPVNQYQRTEMVDPFDDYTPIIGLTEGTVTYLAAGVVWAIGRFFAFSANISITGLSAMPSPNGNIQVSVPFEVSTGDAFNTAVSVRSNNWNSTDVDGAAQAVVLEGTQVAQIDLLKDGSIIANPATLLQVGTNFQVTGFGFRDLPQTG